ncbi:hypothetical protein [Pseudorhodobacter ferrugineus]|uniref:hypothetical protein n=1 Tax=Pseudorhodobacter ferrugineus TaxID=77008 RepID=UPI0012DDD354|nr:hypothetical protein [Pseudorhodobacter ferrugineus]
MIRRGSIILGVLASIFSFVTIDLARNDAIFTVGLTVVEANTPPIIEFQLQNSSNTPMTKLEIRFAIYDRAGNHIRTKNEAGVWEALEESYFTPLGMTIGPNAAKYGVFPFSALEKPVAEIGFAFVCAIFDGSFGIDQVRTEMVLTKTLAGGFGQQKHSTDVYYISSPNCMPPAQFPTK